MKKISTIITTYNSEKYIEETIRSIQSQKGIGSEFDLEIIVIDDCSSDSTKHILDTIRIPFYSTERNTGGPNRGRNIGLDHVTGDFICIVDHDDIWEQNKLQSQFLYLDRVPIVTSGFTLVDKKSGLIDVRVSKENKSHLYFQPNKTFIDRLARNKTGQNTYLGSIIYSSALKHIRFEEHFGGVDYDWVLRLFENQPSIEVCSSLYTRNVNVENLSLRESFRIFDYYYSLMCLEHYETRYPRQVSKSRQRINGSRARYYYLVGNMKQARRFFRKGEINLTTIGYYFSSYFGSDLVKKKFKVFG